MGLSGPTIPIPTELAENIINNLDERNCEGYCHDPDQVLALLYTSLDGRIGNKSKLFRDWIEDKATVMKVPWGRGVVTTVGVRKLTITNETIAVCCKPLAQVVYDFRNQPDHRYTLNSVRTEWKTIEKETQSRIHQVTDLKETHDCDAALLLSMIELCNMAAI